MYIVTAEIRLTGALEYVSPQANELASALRRHTTLVVMIETVNALVAARMLQ